MNLTVQSNTNLTSLVYTATILSKEHGHFQTKLLTPISTVLKHNKYRVNLTRFNTWQFISLFTCNQTKQMTNKRQKKIRQTDIRKPDWT